LSFELSPLSFYLSAFTFELSAYFLTGTPISSAQVFHFSIISRAFPGWLSIKSSVSVLSSDMLYSAQMPCRKATIL